MKQFSQIKRRYDEYYNKENVDPSDFQMADNLESEKFGL